MRYGVPHDHAALEYQYLSVCFMWRRPDRELHVYFNEVWNRSSYFAGKLVYLIVLPSNQLAINPCEKFPIYCTVQPCAFVVDCCTTFLNYNDFLCSVLKEIWDRFHLNILKYPTYLNYNALELNSWHLVFGLSQKVMVAMAKTAVTFEP